MKDVSVLVVETSPLFRLALCNVLVHHGFSVTHADYPLVKPPGSHDVILVDVSTLSDGGHGLEELLAEFSRVGPVLLIAREDRIEELINGIRAGALGFIRQAASERDLTSAVKALANGGTWCDTALFRQIANYLPVFPHLKRARYTKREEDVLACLRRGEHNKEIAQRLGVTEQSVKVYVSNLLRKTGALNRNELAFAAVDSAMGSKA